MTDTISFDSLGLSEKTLKAIQKKGYEEPSPIQAATIPALLKGEQNIIAQAQTGTGKTAAFALPLVDLVDSKIKKVQALVIAPTRELAIQVCEEINSFSSTGLNATTVYGGQSIDQQIRKIKSGVQIVVGTPGRLIDHINRKTLKLGDLRYMILDEADEMLNMGFIDDIETIIKASSDDKRMLMFSATMPTRIKNLAKKYMGDYESITVKKQDMTSNLTEQIYYEVRGNEKFEALCRIIDIENDFYGLIFCSTRRDSDTIAQHLHDRGYLSGAIHGDVSQSQRERILAKFKSKKITILVATDVAARGIDVDNLTHVINYSLPQDPESYVHRIGRTGRAGNQGTAITFITPSEFRRLMVIQKISNTTIKKGALPNARDIAGIKKKQIIDAIESIDENNLDKNFVEMASTLIGKGEVEIILAKALQNAYKKDFVKEDFPVIVGASGGRGGRGGSGGSYGGDKGGSRRDRSRDRGGRDGRRAVDKGGYNGNSSPDMTGKTRLFIAKGRSDNMTPGKVVDFIVQNTGVKSSVIDDAEVFQDFSFINVPFREAETIVEVFKKQAGGAKPLAAKAKVRK